MLRKLLVIDLFILMIVLPAQIMQQGIVHTKAPSGSGTVNLGNQSGSNGSDSNGNNNVLYGLKLTTGANAAGYKITSVTMTTGTFAGTAHWKAAIFDGVTSPYNVICQSAAGTAVLASASTNVLSTIGTDCASSTLAASTAYYFMVNNDLAAAAYATYTAGTGVSYVLISFTGPYTNLGSPSTATEYPKFYVTLTPQ